MKYNRNYNTFVVQFHDITLFLLLFTLLVNFKVTSGSWIFFIFHNTKTYVENWKKCYVQTSSFLHTCFLGKMNKLSKVLWFFFTFRKKCVKYVLFVLSFYLWVLLKKLINFWHLVNLSYFWKDISSFNYVMLCLYYYYLAFIRKCICLLCFFHLIKSLLN